MELPVLHSIPQLDPAAAGELQAFRTMIWDHYRTAGRAFPWRETRDPFAIFISEIMLQQTQTQRVLPKYRAFLERFGSFAELAAADLSAVLPLWSGLGYNRRAKFLLEASRLVTQRFEGRLASNPELLQQLPGVGPNTAGSLAAFVHNRPVVFIETNIRRVFLHYWFPGETGVADPLLLSCIERSLDQDNPREWYYALMDLGAALKSAVPNPNRRSKHYVRQSPFENSQRQLRGRLLRLLQEHGRVDVAEVAEAVGFPALRVAQAVEALENEGFIRQENQALRLKD